VFFLNSSDCGILYETPQHWN